MKHPGAGWYDDVENQTKVRWWDGKRWTDHRQVKIGPVSYTHLDVYKRQMLNGAVAGGAAGAEAGRASNKERSESSERARQTATHALSVADSAIATAGVAVGTAESILGSHAEAADASPTDPTQVTGA